MMRKLVAVEGDVTLPQFGLSSKDLETIIDQVSVVFHSAATVRFDEDIQTAVEMNVNGPRHLLQICRQMEHLEVHTNCIRRPLNIMEIMLKLYITGFRAYFYGVQQLGQ